MQIIQVLPEYIETDPRKKDETWANKIVTQIRFNWRPIIDPRISLRNKQYLFGRQDTASVEAMFADPKLANIDFTPQKPMEKIRNILVADMESEDIQVEVNAIDPSSMDERESDKEMLANRSDTEEFLSHLGATINLPAYNLADEKKLNGKDKFNGDISKFDSMGLNEGSTEDRNYFFEGFYKLRHEASLDTTIRAIHHYNEARKFLPQMCNDIISDKCCAVNAYVDEVSGAPTIAYLAPSSVFAIPGSRYDFKDSAALGWEIDVTISQFMRRMGNSFNMDTDWPWLLRAINAKYNTNYTAIGGIDGTVVYGQCGVNKLEQLVSMQQLYNYKVGLGYVEFKSIDRKSYKFTKKNNFGNPKIFRIPPTSKLQENSKFSRKDIEDETTYKSYYLAIGATDQQLFKYGKLPYAYLEGSEDQISSFTTCVYKEQGPSIAEIAIPHLIIFEKAAKKYEYLINKAKESGYAINMASIIALSQELSSETTKVDPMALLKTMNDSPNVLYTTDDKLGGNGIPFVELKNGLTQAVLEFRQITVNCLMDIQDQLGTAPRMANAPQPREVGSIAQEALNQSKGATGYINRMLMYVFADVSVRLVSYTQDIIKFRKINSIPYNFLRKLLGIEVVADISTMDDIAMHRYGIFVEPFNRKFDREELKQMTIQAYGLGQITIDQMFLINSIDSPKRAAMVLAYQKRRQEAQAKEMAKYNSDLANQTAQMKHQQDMELEQLKGQNVVAAKNAEGEWYYKAMVGAAEMRKEGTTEKLAADKEKQTDKNYAAIEQIEAKKGEA